MSDELLRIEEVVRTAGDADDVLRGVVAELAGSPDIRWAGIYFLESGALELGPEAGAAKDHGRRTVPITWQGAVVGELAAEGTPALDFLERVAERISAHVLLGWDTGGAAWEP